MIEYRSCDSNIMEHHNFNYLKKWFGVTSFLCIILPSFCIDIYYTKYMYNFLTHSVRKLPQGNFYQHLHDFVGWKYIKKKLYIKPVLKTSDHSTDIEVKVQHVE